jgi:hypothetical protein
MTPVSRRRISRHATSQREMTCGCRSQASRCGVVGGYGETAAWTGRPGHSRRPTTARPARSCRVRIPRPCATAVGNCCQLRCSVDRRRRTARTHQASGRSPGCLPRVGQPRGGKRRGQCRGQGCRAPGPSHGSAGAAGAMAAPRAGDDVLFFWTLGLGCRVRDGRLAGNAGLGGAVGRACRGCGGIPGRHRRALPIRCDRRRTPGNGRRNRHARVLAAAGYSWLQE